jgi:hypothetical protein
MKHFNIRYECNDARDDYSSQDRQKRRAMPLFGGLGQTSDESAESDEQSGEWEDILGVDPSATVIKGPKQLAKEKLMREAERVLQTAGWTAVVQSEKPSLVRMIPKKHLSGSQWKQRISNLRADIFAAKFRNAPIAPRKTRPSKEPDLGNDIKILDSHYITKYFKAKSKKAQTVVDSISMRNRIAHSVRWPITP